ncbi:MAG: hypothetical protein LM590_11020 [Thermofilum sp.]|nr:hypothetical protein [Thermofilum sp.]
MEAVRYVQLDIPSPGPPGDRVPVVNPILPMHLKPIPSKNLNHILHNLIVAKSRIFNHVKHLRNRKNSATEILYWF